MFSPPFLRLLSVFNCINMPPLLMPFLEGDIHFSNPTICLHLCRVVTYSFRFQNQGICIVLVFMVLIESMMKRNHESQRRCNLLIRNGTLTLNGGEAMNPNGALLFKTNSWINDDF